MSVVVVSLHERDAPLELLERVAIAERDLAKTLRSLSDSPHLAEVVVLSTCMRTEVYAVLERFHDGIEDLFAFFEARVGDSEALRAALGDSLIVSPDDSAVRHLFDVAAGVDSAVLGEGEILRQVRSAQRHARSEHTLGPVLDALFRHAIEVGKRARTETDISRGMTSLAHAAVALALDQLGGSFATKRVVVTGAGEMGAGIVRAIVRAPGSPELVIVNRSSAHASELALESGARVSPLRAIEEELQSADVLFSATAGGEVLVDADLVDRSRGTHPERSLLVIDAAVPRDIDEAVGALSLVSLFDLDDLLRFAETRMLRQKGQLPRVGEIVDEELERYRTNSRGRSAVPVIAALRSRAEQVRVAELERVTGRLDQLDPADRELVQLVTRRIVAKLVHEPTVQMKSAAGSARGERLVDALRTLFDL